MSAAANGISIRSHRLDRADPDKIIAAADRGHQVLDSIH